MASSTNESVLRLELLSRVEPVLEDASPSVESEVIGLFDELYSPLLRYMLSFGIRIADGEDLIQETFLALFRHLQRRKSRENLRGWMFRVAHNLALKHRGKRDYRVTTTCSESELAERQIDPGTNPEQQLAHNQRQKILQTVMSTLPERDQRCLRLRAEGLHYREIAEALGISLGSVANSLARAYQRLNCADRR